MSDTPEVPRIDLDAADLRPLAGAAADLLARLQDYQRVGSPTQYQVGTVDNGPHPRVPVLQAYGEVATAMLAVEQRLSDLGLDGTTAPVLHGHAMPPGVCDLWLMLRSARSDLGSWGHTINGVWGLHPGQQRLRDPAPLILQLTQDLGAMGGQALETTPMPTLPTIVPGGFLYGGREFPLRGKALEVLGALVGAPRQVCTVQDLLAEVWGDQVVSEDTVRSFVRDARQALRDALQALKLAGPPDPIPTVDRGSGRLAWRLDLP
jgi:hypothetical protein